MANMNSDPELRAAATSMESRGTELLAGTIAVGVKVTPSPNLLYGHNNWRTPADIASRRYTAEGAHRDHVRQVEGPDAEPLVPFDELSDMAIQGYEIEADMINAGRQVGEQ